MKLLHQFTFGQSNGQCGGELPQLIGGICVVLPQGHVRYKIPVFS
jgi:hypothetical protein